MEERIISTQHERTEVIQDLRGKTEHPQRKRRRGVGGIKEMSN